MGLTIQAVGGSTTLALRSANPRNGSTPFQRVRGLLLLAALGLASSRVELALERIAKALVHEP